MRAGARARASNVPLERDCRRCRDPPAAAAFLRRTLRPWISSAAREKRVTLLRGAASATPEFVDLRSRPRGPSPGAAAGGARAVRDHLDRLARRVAARELARRGNACELCADPDELVAAAPAGTRFVVMTHDHALDYELCRVILARADSSWLGLIGSASKSARFRSRLLRDGLEPRDGVATGCPIGVPGISSKLPGCHRDLDRRAAAAAIALPASARRERSPACRSGRVHEVLRPHAPALKAGPD